MANADSYQRNNFVATNVMLCRLARAHESVLAQSLSQQLKSESFDALAQDGRQASWLPLHGSGYNRDSGSPEVDHTTPICYSGDHLHFLRSGGDGKNGNAV